MLAFSDHSMMYPSAHGRDEIRVRIIHRQDEGYPLSANGQEIKEELPLVEFLMRIFKDERHVDHEIYRVRKTMSMHDNRESSHLAEKYNQMYVRLFTSQQAVLAQHQMKSRHMSNFERDRYQEQWYQRSAMQQTQSTPIYGGLAGLPSGAVLQGPSQSEMLEREKNKAEKKRTDDLFFLTT